MFLLWCPQTVVKIPSSLTEAAVFQNEFSWKSTRIDSKLLHFHHKKKLNVIKDTDFSYITFRIQGYFGKDLITSSMLIEKTEISEKQRYFYHFSER